MHFTLVPGNLAVCAGLAHEQLLGQAMKNLADVLGTAAVEAKRELVQR